MSDKIQALRIVKFDELFEMTDSNRAWYKPNPIKNKNTGQYYQPPNPIKRVGPFAYLRYPIDSPAMSTGEAFDLIRMFKKMARMIGRSRLGKVRDLFFGLASLAAQAKSDRRGWVVIGGEALGPVEIAEELLLEVDDVAQGIEILITYDLVRWEVCGFVKTKAGNVFYLSNKSDAPESAKTADLLKHNQSKIKKLKNKIEADEPVSCDESEFEGLPGRAAESLGSLEFDNIEDADLTIEDIESLEIENLPSGPARQGASAHINKEKKQDKKSCHSSWYDSINGCDLENEDPYIIGNDLAKNEDYQREQVIERALTWLRFLLPEYLDFDESKPYETRQKILGCETTVCRKMKALFEKEKVNGVIWFIKRTQRAMREAKNSRGRVRNIFAMVVADANTRLGLPRSQTAGKGL